MCYFALYNNGMDELQGNRVFYATFNSLYLVSSNILLTHRYRYYRPDFHFIFVRARAREKRAILYNKELARVSLFNLYFLFPKSRKGNRICIN